MTQCSIDLEFADGTYTFALPLPQIRELQDSTGIGVGGMFARVIKGVTPVGNDHVLVPGAAEFHALDLVETVRLGLIGGGKGMVNGEEVKVTPVKARQLVDRYVTPPAAPLVQTWELAVSILGTCVMGFDPPKKDQPAQEPAADEQTAG